MNQPTCPECGTPDCISLKEYRRHIKITGAGVISVPSEIVLKTCRARKLIREVNRLIKR